MKFSKVIFISGLLSVLYNCVACTKIRGTVLNEVRVNKVEEYVNTFKEELKQKDVKDVYDSKVDDVRKALTAALTEKYSSDDQKKAEVTSYVKGLVDDDVQILKTFCTEYKTKKDDEKDKFVTETLNTFKENSAKKLTTHGFITHAVKNIASDFKTKITAELSKNITMKDGAVEKIDEAEVGKSFVTWVQHFNNSALKQHQAVDMGCKEDEIKATFDKDSGIQADLNESIAELKTGFLTLLPDKCPKDKMGAILEKHGVYFTEKGEIEVSTDGNPIKDAVLVGQGHIENDIFVVSAGGMNTLTKVLIAGGLLALVGGGSYMYLRSQKQPVDVTEPEE